MAGFLTGLTGGISDSVAGATDTPTYQPASIDQSTTDSMSTLQNNANKSTQDMANSTTNGAQASGAGMLQSGEDASRNSLGGNPDPGMRDALQARAQRSYGSSVNQIGRKALITAQSDKTNNMNQAFNLQDQITQRNMEIQETQAQNQIQQQAARNSVISGVLGAVGGIAGSALKGGGGA